MRRGGLRLRLALSFAAVALATAAAVALAAPHIVSQGFAILEQESEMHGAASGAVGTPQPVGAIATATPLPSPSSADTTTPTAPPTAAPSPVATPTPLRVAAAESEAGEGSDAGEGGETLGASEAVEPSDTGGAGASSEAPELVAVANAPTAGPTAEPPTPAMIAEKNTTSNLIAVAVVAAILASLLGFLIARRMTRPLLRLEEAAGAVARGDLGRRSGLAGRHDEIGQLGRSFDAMAGQLAEAEEARRRFLQDVAHELRTPLAVIDATASAILDGVYPPERRHIDTIRDQSRVLARIVEDLRTISLAEVGRLPLDRQAVEVGGLLEGVAAGFEAQASATGVRLEVDAQRASTAFADEARLRQILGALVDNALRYTPAGGSVRLVAFETRGEAAGTTGGSPPAQPPGAAPRRVHIAVEDSGRGFPPDVLPRVFERFYQGDPSHTRRSGTSGLGLSIVHALVEAHGGRVGAENRAGGGARVWFELPVARAGSAGAN